MATPREHAPRLVASCDLGALKIGPLERFVLANVDGKRTAAALAEATGLGEGDVDRILAQLATLGAIEPWSPNASTATAGRKSGTQPAAAPPAAGTIELDPALQARVASTFDKLDELDHYALLGVPRDADRKAIKGAYFSLASTFHTDRHFGKSLGPFKSKMELIFGRLTAAHDVLANKARRAEYDGYLVERDRTQAYERLMRMVEGEGDLGGELRAAAATQEPVRTPGGELAMIAPAGTPAEQARSAPCEPPPPSAPAPSPSPTAALDHERARREMLARRLSGSRAGSTRRPAPIGQVAPIAPRAAPSIEEGRAAAEALKRMYEDRKDGARRAQAAKFVEAADQAMIKDDVVAAANQLRLAVKYTEDPDVHRRFEQVNGRARELVAAAYVKQATYEEQQQKWHEAALSYVKAIEGRPNDPELHDRAANALRREGRDLHLAARHAELAVQKNPNRADFRVTLGNVYLDVGLFLRARTELDQAHKLDANAPRLKELLAQVKKLVG